MENTSIVRTSLLLCFICSASAVNIQAAQTCDPNSIPSSTPDNQLIDNGDGTITDSKTGLMWKKCLEGVTGALCNAGSLSTFTWQEALKQPEVVNSESGFAGHTDWRLPNIRELFSIIEGQCYDPSINLNRFPNTPNSDVWSGTPVAYNPYLAWVVYFYDGHSNFDSRDASYPIRLVRGGQ